ncbi:PLDc N-terminal domain-containing protein [Mucilaginibacter ginsenosidivorans]|uniref:Cardiolipin synthase N-terminal domain-containing protein n=1 Tax=Mucilaginibacter ginsenosidivorans TaxID=398053 RepID=A0A5B8UX69_9SPHI|nr:PLDc N-terminal domain-containing protein [Mucilaginibacter ginsenosidivorans]QEC63542.1 hypothetical protein FRZ54_13460 [Mucilaginibacter ginsenosidivorans]
MLPFGNNYLYYIEIGLQVICAIHSVRRGTQGKWLWIIIFLPLVGSLIYIFSEMRPGRNLTTPKIDIGMVINPSANLKKLEDNLKFTDTFDNKIKLADAYLAAGQTERAIELYEKSLTGAFAENEHGIAQLATAYFQNERYPDTISTLKKIYNTHQFARSHVHVLYARALELTGNTEAAEHEFKLMKGRYSNFEQRYEYGLFLERADRIEDAYAIFEQMLDEAPHLSSIERKSNRVWLSKAKEEMKRITV